jgi:tetratricopeptide (TPR) repeat protein
VPLEIDHMVTDGFIGRSLLALMPVVLLVLQSCAAPTHADRPPGNASSASSAPTVSVGIVRRDIQQALGKMRNQNYQGADEQLRGVVDTQAFAELTAEEQRVTLYIAAVLAATLEQWERAHALSVRATVFSTADADAWHERFGMALAVPDFADAALDLTTIAQRWPSTLSDIDDRTIFEVVRKIRNLPRGEQSWLQLVDALQWSGWRMSDQLEPSDLWRDLTQYYVARKSWERAAEVAAHVTSPQTLIAMRSDKQFDRVLGSNRLVTDIDRAAAEEIDLLRVAARRAPRSLQIGNNLAVALMLVNRNDEALKLLDGLLARIRSETGKESPFDDTSDQLNGVQDNRARALRALGRWDEVVEQWSRAGRLSEHGDVNVSHAINLGYFYCDLDRPRDALAVIARVGRTSPYGTMQLESVRHAAARELNDTAEAGRALEYLRKHQAEAPATYQWALARANDVVAGSRLLVARLADPKLRTDALADVQQYAEPSVPPRAQAWRTNWLAVIARPEVQAAIVKVGRVGSYNIASR